MSEITKKSVGQKDAEAEVESFREDLGPFVVAAETTRMAMLFADAAKPDHPIIFANDSFLALTGYDREEVLGKSFNFLMGLLERLGVHSFGFDFASARLNSKHGKTVI